MAARWQPDETGRRSPSRLAALLLALTVAAAFAGPAAAQDATPPATPPVAEDAAPGTSEAPEPLGTDDTEMRPLETVEVSPDQPVIDLTAAFVRLEADNGIALADGTALEATDTEPARGWILFALRNGSDLPVRRVLAFERGALWGAGIAPVRSAASEFGLWRTVGAPAPVLLGGLGSKRYALDLPPGATATYAIPVGFAQEIPAYLWLPGALAAADAGSAAFSGLLIGSLALAFAFFMARWASGDQVDAHLAALICGAALFFELVTQGLAGAAFGWSGGVDTRLYGASLALTVAAGAFVLANERVRALPPERARLTRWAAWVALGAVLLALVFPSIGLPFARLLALAVSLGGFAALMSPGRSTGLHTEGPAVTELRIGWGVLAVAVAIASLATLGFMPRSPAIGMMVHALAALGALVACYALGGRTAVVSVQRHVPVPHVEPRPAPQPEPEPVSPADQVRAEQRNAIALAGASEAVWDLDVTTGALYVDPSLEAHLGLVPGGIGGRLEGWLARVHPEDRADVSAALDHYVEQGNATFSLLARMRHAEGAVMWIEVKASCFAGPSGQARRCVGTAADVTSRRTVETELAEETLLRDHLTGLPNRALFMDRLDRACRLRDGGTRRVALMLADIDRFKLVNESLGHAAADTVLAALARRLEGLIAPEDTLARIDGDTYAIIIAGWSDETGPEDIATLVRETIAQPLEVSGREIFPTASVGVAVCESRHETGEELLGEADIALRRAKAGGGNDQALFTPDMRPLSDNLATESALRRALERSEIKLAYQPIVRFETGQLAGFEALIRWSHPERGELSPDVFVPLAEETGLIIELGHFVLESAAADLARWQEAFPAEPPLFVSVNVSSRQLLRGLPKDVQGVLEKTGVPPETLRLEVTESLVMENPEQAAGILKEVKETGVRLALDDFGTGYSSLSYLQRFPFDVVKIDRSFVTGLVESEDEGAIVRSVLSLAGDLKLDVVAEGVEDEGQAERLTELGCQYGQGFYFGTPMEANAAKSLIARYRENEKNASSAS